MRWAVATAGCALLTVGASAQPRASAPTDFRALEPYLNHSDSAVRRAAVLLLTEAILGEPQPRSLEAEPPTREVLSKMRATELDIVFDRCKKAWSVSVPDPRPRQASQYEQLHRFIYVLRSMDSLDGFGFEGYVNADQRSITELALTGMALVYTPEYKKRLEALAAGVEPMATWAKDALALRKHAPFQPIFRDDADNRWAYEAMVEMQNKGLLIGYSFGMGHVRHHSRYEFARATQAAYERTRTLVSNLQAEIDSIKTEPTSGVMRERLQGLRPQVASLKELVTEKVLGNLLRLSFEFDRDLRDLGVDTSAMRVQIRDWLPRAMLHS